MMSIINELVFEDIGAYDKCINSHMLIAIMKPVQSSFECSGVELKRPFETLFT